MMTRRLCSAVLVMLTASVLPAADSGARLIPGSSILSHAEQLSTDARIAFLAQAVKDDQRDARKKAALASAFIQKLRETGDGSYLKNASAMVDSILAVEPGFRQALRLRNEIEMNLHHFPTVAGNAEAMLASDPGDASTAGMLGDALMELGQYERAGAAYKRMISLGANLFSYNRLAYHQFVTGNAQTALAWMAQAIAAGGKSPENVAWCYTDMGDMLFKLGRVKDAEYAFQQALRIFPGYHRAHAGAARALAARGDIRSAIGSLLKAQKVVPLPEYAGSLELLYQMSGDEGHASRQRDLMEAISRLMAVNGEKANRTLALIFADRNRNIPRAFELATAEFEVRNDVYSHDALSWVLYRKHEFPEARKASRKALALGTSEPGFYFHAGMIAFADGDHNEARNYLAKALSLNPDFDPANAPLAKATLEQLSGARNQ